MTPEEIVRRLEASEALTFNTTAVMDEASYASIERGLLAWPAGGPDTLRLIVKAKVSGNLKIWRPDESGNPSGEAIADIDADDLEFSTTYELHGAFWPDESGAIILVTTPEQTIRMDGRKIFEGGHVQRIEEALRARNLRLGLVPPPAAAPLPESPPRRKRGRPPKARPERSTEGDATKEDEARRTSVAFKIPTSKEIQTVCHVNLAPQPTPKIQGGGAEYVSAATRRRVRIAPKAGEIAGEDQVAQYVGRVALERGPIAIKALFGFLRYFDAVRGMQSPEPVRVLVSDLAPFCGYGPSPSVRTIKDIAHGLWSISCYEIEASTVKEWTERQKPKKVEKSLSRVLNLERRGFLSNLFEDDPAEGDPSTYWVECSVPKWLRDQFVAGGGSGQQWWPMLDRILSFDASTQRPQFCLALYLAFAFRVAQPGQTLTRGALDIAEKSGYQPGRKTRRWLDELPRFLNDLHERAPEFFPKATVHDPGEGCPLMAPAERMAGYQVTWIVPDPLTAALPGGRRGLK